MAPTQTTEDYYAVLEISQTADEPSIKSSYRRLAMTRHPDKNPTNPNATAEFQLLTEAYEILCNPEARRIYDASIKRTQQTKPKTATGTSWQNPSSGNKDTEEKERKKKERAALREKKLQELQSRLTRQSNKVFEAKRTLNKTQGMLDKIQREADEEASEQAAKGSWWGYLASYVTGQARETEKEKLERERRQLDRGAAQRIKEKQLEQDKAKVRAFETCVHETENEIRRIKQEISQEQYEERQAKQREEQKRWEENMEKIRRENERIAEERRRKRAAEAQEQRRRSQAKAEEEKQRKREEEDMRARAQNAASRSTSKMAACDHMTWWSRVEGGRRCSRCSILTRRFAFQCPRCSKVACASCRDILKGTRSRQSASRNFGTRGDSYDSTWSRPAFDDYDYYDYYGT